MVIVGVLLIVVVLFDAWRRIRRDSHYSRIKVKLVDPGGQAPAQNEDLAWLKELPNGGARVVDRGQSARVKADRQNISVQTATNSPVEPFIGGLSSDEPAEGENLDWLDWLGAAAPAPAQENAEAKLPREVDSEVFMLNVVARSPAGFRGEDILHILLACDLRFGDMSFFHRHEQDAGQGAIQFSVANMMQPGVFDIDNMSDLGTPGLIFFLTLPGPEDMIKAYDYMLETAQTVSRNLGGDVLDESRSVLTKQSIEHSRQQIRDLERRLLARAR